MCVCVCGGGGGGGGGGGLEKRLANVLGTIPHHSGPMALRLWPRRNVHW